MLNSISPCNWEILTFPLNKSDSFIFVIDQEEVVRRHMEAKVKRNILILRELRAKNLVNGAGKLPTQAQVS